MCEQEILVVDFSTESFLECNYVLNPISVEYSLVIFVVYVNTIDKRIAIDESCKLLCNCNGITRRVSRSTERTDEQLLIVGMHNIEDFSLDFGIGGTVFVSSQIRMDVCPNIESIGNVLRHPEC